MNKKETYRILTGEFFEAMNLRETDKMRERVCDDVSLDFPGIKLVEGKKRVLIFINSLLRKYKTLNFEILDVLVDGDRACVIWKNSGKMINDKDYSNNGVTYFRFMDEKIEFISDYFKDTSFTQNQ